jgi:hypothetical protein
MILLDLLVGQYEKGLFSEPIDNRLRDLRWAQDAIDPGRSAIRPTQHRCIDCLRAQTTDFNAIIAVTDRQ